jgi:hypothetical protein
LPSRTAAYEKLNLAGHVESEIAWKAIAVAAERERLHLSSSAAHQAPSLLQAKREIPRSES